MTYKVGSKNVLVSKYCDVKKWITDNTRHDPDFDDKFVDVVYTWAKYPNHEWDEYNAVEAYIININQRLHNNKTLKGCVVKSISNVKTQLVKDL